MQIGVLGRGLYWLVVEVNLIFMEQIKDKKFEDKK